MRAGSTVALQYTTQTDGLSGSDFTHARQTHESGLLKCTCAVHGFVAEWPTGLGRLSKLIIERAASHTMSMPSTVPAVFISASMCSLGCPACMQGYVRNLLAPAMPALDMKLRPFI